MTTGGAVGSGQSSIGASRLQHRTALATPPVMRVLPGVPESAAAARQVTRQLLGDGHPAADTAMLLVSELVANSVMHSQSGRPGGTVTVAVCARPTSVLIQVRDEGGPSGPRMLAAHTRVEGGTRSPAGLFGATGSPAAAGDGEHGYGLLLVDALAETWGTVATEEGRVTWCRLAVDRSDDDERR
jgi:anti-sigma regulatory factor (Ser/Thr protein kinase)